MLGKYIVKPGLVGTEDAEKKPPAGNAGSLWAFEVNSAAGSVAAPDSEKKPADQYTGKD